MATITASQVKELRERTGVGLMECKKALAENGGDIDQSIQYLREKGLSKAAKKAERSTNEGKVTIVESADKKTAVILEVNCETDFVANNEDFLAFGAKIANTILEQNVETLDALEAVSIDGKNLSELTGEYVLKLGENIKVKQFKVVKADYVASYTHMTGKIASVIGFSGAVEEDTAKDIAMHTTAVNPPFLNKDQVSEADLENEKNILKTQAENEGKPADVVEKIVMGKINKFYKENCLLEQAFVKDDKKSVKDLLPSGVTITEFVRYQLG
jgi:elongation factor Ts